MKRIYYTLITLLFCALIASCATKSEIAIQNIQCEMQTNPQGIDCISPRLSWELSATGRDVQQTNYHILVASSLEKLDANEGDLWDSKVVKSDESIYIPYTGKKLESRAEYYWKVKVKTNRGESEWSEPASWTMGLMNSSDWQAKWTGLDKSFDGDVLVGKTRLAARYFRKEFETKKEIKKAVLYISGLGFYEAYINNNRIGTQVLAPTPTDYSKVVKYNTFDVTKDIISGNNAIGVVLGGGRYFSMREPGIRHFGFPKMLLQLEVEYTDGEKESIISDNSWKVTANGPIRSNSEFDGEEYNALMEMPGWDKSGFDDSKWLQAELVTEPGGKVEAQLNPNIQVMDTIKPIAITEQKPGTFIMDMGQNMVGWLRLKVKGEKGKQVQLRFAELLKNDGSLYMDNLRSALVTDKYTMKGDGQETWQPTFTYHGFRFVEISGFPGTPTINDFEGLVLYDEMETIGEFETSNETINQIYKNSYWGIRGNYRGMPTDCPQRDERMGWLGDRAVGSHGESFIFDNNLLYSKWLDDIEQSQLENGALPAVAPNYWSVYVDDVTWPAAYLIIANMLYEQFGNKEPIVKHYDSMKKWLDYMKDTYMVDNIMPKDNFGDWCMPPESQELIHSQDPARKTEGAVLGTTFYYRMMYLMEQFANILDKPEDAKDFAQQAVLMKDAFNNKFLNKETGQYSNNTVAANLLALCYGMVPKEYENAVFKNIVDKTENEFNGHVSTGLIGMQWLMRGLSDNGRADLAYKLATNRSYPSWGYMAENGATTIWELWNGNTADPAMNSANHVMLLGDLIIWYYEYLAGIQNASGSFGFKQISMKPYTVEGLDFVKASYKSPHGLIKSSWNKTQNTFKWDITIPANSSAIVYIPATDKDKVKEGEKKAASAEGVKFIKIENNYAVFEVRSGSYNFSSE